MNTLTVSAIGKYRLRVAPVLAAQWDGTNVADMVALAGANFRTGNDGAEVYDVTRGVWVPIRPGEWLIAGDTGGPYVRDTASFAAYYEVAP